MTTVIAPGYDVLMQQPARDRIVRSAAALVRERGVHGVGLRQIVAHADGPRGSLQRYFPGGKTQLITEALNLAGAEVLDETESGLIEAATLADAIDAIFAPWRQVLVESNFTMGCPLAATVIDAGGDDRLRQEARALLDQWRDSIHAALVKFGVQESTAEDDASVLLAALEGALILSRASQSTQPLDTVQRFFTTSLTQAAANRAGLERLVAAIRKQETMTDLTLTELADRLAIRELEDAYARCADRRDADGQKSLFTEDTHFVVYMDGEGTEPTQALTGREALTPVFDALNTYQATMHFNGQTHNRVRRRPSDRRELLHRPPPVHRRRRAQADGRAPPLPRHIRQARRRLAVRRAQALRRLDRDSLFTSLAATLGAGCFVTLSLWRRIRLRSIGSLPGFVLRPASRTSRSRAFATRRQRQLVSLHSWELRRESYTAASRT